MQRFFSPASKLVFGVRPKAFYPFGKARAIDVLADFIPSPSKKDSTKVLLLTATDLHTTMQTVAASATSRNQQSKPLEIHLNNSCTLNMARNLFLFHVISRSPDFSSTDFQYLWDAWFNLEWSGTTKKRFLSDITTLLKENNSPSNAIVSPHVLEAVHTIWSDWLLSTTRLSKTDAMKDLHEKRTSQIRFHLGVAPCHLIENDLESAVDVKITNEEAFYKLGNVVTVGTISREARSQLLGETALYYFLENGNCYLDKREVKLSYGENTETEVACLNPTFFGPSADQWLVHHSVNPFSSFLPLPPDAIKVNPGEVIFFGRDRNSVNLRIQRLTTKYCHQQLASLLTAFKKNTDYKVFFHNEDPLQLCFNPIIPPCDVVDCSDLADEVGLANVIVSATNQLVQQPSSLLFTETRTWKSGSSSPQPNLEEYVKEELCAPLSMIPTLYGVQLATPVRLGSITPPDEKLEHVQDTLVKPLFAIENLLEEAYLHGLDTITPEAKKYGALISRSLKWRPAPSFRNVRLDHSEALENCLIQLKDRCNLGQIAQPGSMYTSLTYSYICSGLAQRTGNRRWMQFGFNEVDPTRRLSMKTMEHWKEGGCINQFSFSVKCPKEKDLLLGLVLVPLDTLPHASTYQIPNDSKPPKDVIVHYLDSADFKVIRSPTGDIQELLISFLLPEDHVFESTFCAEIVNNLSGKKLSSFIPVSRMEKELFTPTYPTFQSQSGSILADEVESTSFLSCTETEKSYELVFNFPNFSPHMLSVADCFPCQSLNRFTLTKESQPPQEFAFPHPVINMEHHFGYSELSLSRPCQQHSSVCSSVYSRPCQQHLCVFQKSFYEPLPQDFQRVEKWDSQKLPCIPLEKPKKRGGIVRYTKLHSIITPHLRGQTVRSVEGYEVLDELRGLVKLIFTDVLKARKDPETDGIFMIKSLSSSSNVEWYLRAHLPFRISPDGAPMLVLSAFDTKLANHLLSSDEPSEKRGNLFGHELAKIYNDDDKKPYRFPVRYEDDETLLLFRYLLRFNSTLILPNEWQMKVIVPEQEKPSPWLTTFISPLYPDCPLPQIIGSIINIIKS